jgi:hypothetical protein
MAAFNAIPPPVKVHIPPVLEECQRRAARDAIPSVLVPCPDNVTSARVENPRQLLSSSLVVLLIPGPICPGAQNVSVVDKKRR